MCIMAIILAVTRQKIMHNYFVVYCNIEKNVYSMVIKYKVSVQGKLLLASVLFNSYAVMYSDIVL